MKTLKIVIDHNPCNPREGENLGTMVYSHRRYSLGDKDMNADPIFWLEEQLNIAHKHVYTNERFSDLNRQFLSKNLALPLYLYDHSGLCMSTKPFSCPWDSGQVGYICVDKEKARKEFKVKQISPKLKKSILMYLQSEVDLFNHYLQNEVYGFQILDEGDNEIHSCYGFYGTDFMNNGMKDHIPEELHDQLRNATTDYIYA